MLISQKLMSAPVAHQARKLSPKARTQSQRPPRVAALINWLFRYNEDLLRAVWSEDETKLQQALEKGADVNMKNKNEKG